MTICTCIHTYYIHTYYIHTYYIHIEEPTKAVLAPNGAPIYRIERGGEVTYHGPGQIVCYPLLDLTKETYNKQTRNQLHIACHPVKI